MALHTIAMQPATGDPAITNTAIEWRNFHAGLLASRGGVAGQEGVSTAADFKVVQRGAGANFSVDVPGGWAWVNGDDVTGQGSYFVWLDGTTNVVTPTAPGSGTQIHRLVLQIQDKLSNGVWAGYQAALVLLADTGTGTPAEGNSAITLAFISIAAGQASVLNANITDYRQRVADIQAVATADDPAISNNASTFIDSASMQLLNLAATARYQITGNILYSALNGVDIQWKWRQGGGTPVFKYNGWHYSLSASHVGSFSAQGSDTLTALGQGTGQNMGITVSGEVLTGTAPAFLIFQCAQNTAGASNLTIRGHSTLTARRIA